jgi:hypothetical protein
MGAFIGISDVGIWASNSQRDTFLDWFAEFRCSSGDGRWQWCQSAAQRWLGRCIDLSESLQAGETFQISEAEDSFVEERYGPDVARLLKPIEKIHRGEWEHKVNRREAVEWRDGCDGL